MNFYEHTIIARQDTSPTQLKQLLEKYTNLVNKNEGKVVKARIAKFGPVIQIGEKEDDEDYLNSLNGPSNVTRDTKISKLTT